MTILSELEIELRRGVERIVDVVGGARAALALGCSPGRVSLLANINSDAGAVQARRHLKASEVPILDGLYGQPVLLGILASAEAYNLSAKSNERPVAAEGVIQHLSSITKEVSEALAVMAEAARKTTPTLAEARRIHSELQDVIDRASEAKSEMARILAGPQVVSK